LGLPFVGYQIKSIAKVSRGYKYGYSMVLNKQLYKKNIPPVLPLFVPPYKRMSSELGTAI
jgi:hypothetical protein